MIGWNLNCGTWNWIRDSVSFQHEYTSQKKVTLFPTYISSCISSFWQIRINYVYLFQYRFPRKILFYCVTFDSLWIVIGFVVTLLIKKTLYYKNYIFNNIRNKYFYINKRLLNKFKIIFLIKFLDWIHCL